MPMRLLCLVMILMSALTAHAGCAATPTVNSAYTSTPLIFRGRVLKVFPDRPSPEWGVPARSSAYGGVGSDVEPLFHIRLQVLEVFKGDPGSEITVLGTERLFGKGGEFLVYAVVGPGTNPSIIAAGCSRNGEITAPDSVADLAWLRAHRAAPSTPKAAAKD
jgi:hypothetical protein